MSAVLWISWTVALGAPPVPATVAREQAAATAYSAALLRYDTGTGTLDDVYVWSRRWYDSQGADARAAAAHAERMTALATKVHDRVASGTAPTFDEAAAAWYVADAQVLTGRP